MSLEWESFLGYSDGDGGCVGDVGSDGGGGAGGGYGDDNDSCDDGGSGDGRCSSNSSIFKSN